MSGGSYNYIYNKLLVECAGEMHDAEMDEMLRDFCGVLHDLEWWQSGDYSEDQYRETVSEFKKKWFTGDRSTRLKGYIDDQINAVRRQLYSLIGEEGTNIFEEIANQEKQPTTIFCEECGITETRPYFGQQYCRYCGAKFKDEEGKGDKK